jgi:DHA1 family multidrug resistance protein-like MFS transporter
MKNPEQRPRLSSRSRLPFVTLYSVLTTLRGVAGFLLPLYFVSVGIPDIQVGVSIGLFGASLLVFEVLWGVLFDRIGAERLLLANTGLTAATYLYIPFVRDVDGAFVAELLLGASGPILAVVTRSLVIRQSDPKRWAGGFGFLGAIYALAQIVGYLIGSLSRPGIDFGETFLLASALTVAGYLGYLAVRRGERPVPAAPAPGPGPSRADPPPKLDWLGLPLMSLVAVPTFIGFSFFVNIMQLVLTQTPSIGATDLQAGVVLSTFWVSNVVFQPLLSSRGGGKARLTIAIALAGSFGVFALLTQLHDVWQIGVAGLLEGACFSAISPLSLSLLMVGIPTRYVGRAMGIYGAAEDIGIIIGPVIGSAIWVQYGLAAAYLTLGATFLAVLVPYAAMTWYPNRRPRDKSYAGART